jgi:hypothetical protein
VAEKPYDSFVADYLARQREAYRQQIMGQSGAPSTPPSNLRSPEPEVGFLGGVIDFFSRPLYAVTNIADKALDLPERFKQGEGLEGVGALAASPFTGFFSGGIMGERRREDKNYTSDILEKASDVINRDNPTYVNKENNIDPVTKGTLGFIGDLALDPLMYVPGGQIAKLANLGLRGVRKIAGAAPKAAATTKASEQVLDTVIGADRNTKAPAKNIGDVAEATNSPAQAGLKLTDRIAEGIKKGQLPQDIAKSSLRGMVNDSKVFRNKSRRNQMDKLLKTWQSGRLVDDLPTFDRVIDFPSWRTTLEGLSLEAKASISVPVKIGGLNLKEGNLKALAEKVQTMPPEEAAAFLNNNAGTLDEIIYQPLYQAFTEGVKANGRADLLGRVPRAMDPEELASNVVGRIATLADTEIRNAEEVFTKPLFNSLRGMNPEEMAKFLDNSQNVLRQKGLVEGMGVISGRSAERNLLRAFDITLEQYRNAVDDLTERVDSLLRSGPAKPIDTAVDDLVTDPGFMVEMRARFAAIGIDDANIIADAARIVKESLAKSFKRNFDESDLKKRGYKPTIGKDGQIYVTDAQLGEGVARILNSYNSGAQNDFYTELSKGMKVLFEGVPLRDEAGNIVSKFVSGRRVYEYEQLPKHVKGGPGSKAYNAYKGFDLAQISEDTTLAALKSAEDFITSKGIPIVIDYAAKGAKRAVQPLRLSDIYEVTKIGYRKLAEDLGLSSVAANRMMQLLFFNADTGMSRAHLMDAVMALMNGASKSDLLTIVTSGTTRYGKKLEPGANWLSGTKNSRFGFFPKNIEFPRNIPGLEPEPLFRQTRRGEEFMGNYAVWNNKVAAETLVDALLAARNGFENVSQIRKQQYLARSIEEFRYISPKVAQQFLRFFKDEQATATAFQATENMGSIVIDYAKAIDATDVAAAYTAGAIRNVIPRTVETASKYSNDFFDAIQVGDRARLEKLREQATEDDFFNLKRSTDEGLDAAEEVASNPGVYGETAEEMAERVRLIETDNPAIEHNGFAQIKSSMQRIIAPLNAKWGMDVKNHLSAWLEFESLGVSTGTYISMLKSLSNLRKKYPTSPNGTPLLTSAMRELQQAMRRGLSTGEDALNIINKQTNAELREATLDLYREIGKVFNVKSKLIVALKNALNSPFGRMGIEPETLNVFFARAGLLGRTEKGMAKLPESGSFIDANKVAKEAAEQGLDRMTVALNQWVDWKIDNPIDFLTNAHSAIYKMSSEITFIDNFRSYMTRQGLSVSNALEAKKLGYVKLSGGSGSHFGILLPDNIYVHEEVAFIFKQMDNAMKPSEFLDTKLGQGIRTFFDPILNRWKTTVTILRPGHHLRNYLGAMSLRFFALGAKYFGWGDDTAGRLLAGIKNNYTDADMLRAQGQMTNSVAKDSEVIIRSKLGNVTARQAQDDMTKYLFIEGKRAEDLMEDGILKTKYSKNVDKFFQYVTFGAGKRGGIVEEVALDVSWYVQHRNITAHYLQALRQALEATPKKPFVRGLTETVVPKTMDEARALALESALKNHPTPNMLSAWEKVFPRRLFPFYTWIKLASVALVESSILNPARTLTTIPKASYNLAVAMGVDPYSMYHPFPEDQLFPSFLTDEMTGPQFEIGGKYVGFSPGFASLDIYNTFADPLEGVTQLTNPMIRIPIELLAGSRLGTQAPITDLSDYLDSSVPGINYVSNITGRSIFGLGAPQAPVERGNKTGFDRSLSAINWTFGISARNYSRPNYINFAEIELRNKAAEEARVEQNLVNFLLGRLD